jgi:hypothetical protein
MLHALLVRYDRTAAAADVAGAAVDLTWTELEYYWLAACVLV